MSTGLGKGGGVGGRVGSLDRGKHTTCPLVPGCVPKPDGLAAVPSSPSSPRSKARTPHADLAAKAPAFRLPSTTRGTAGATATCHRASNGAPACPRPRLTNPILSPLAASMHSSPRAPRLRRPPHPAEPQREPRVHGVDGHHEQDADHVLLQPRLSVVLGVHSDLGKEAVGRGGRHVALTCVRSQIVMCVVDRPGEEGPAEVSMSAPCCGGKGRAVRAAAPRLWPPPSAPPLDSSTP